MPLCVMHEWNRTRECKRQHRNLMVSAFSPPSVWKARTARPVGSASMAAPAAVPTAGGRAAVAGAPGT